MDDFDSPWKEILDVYFEAFLEFFFPKVHADVDWSRGYDSLDKELQPVLREAETGRRSVDKLFKVWLKDGTEEWLLIHVEIQSQPDPDFARRIFVYNYRLYDHYARKVVSLAVLADDQPSWRPSKFAFAAWDFCIVMKFPTVKLLDYWDRLSELEASKNPFAVVVHAHLRTLAADEHDPQRCRWKLQIFRQLYERGLDERAIRRLGSVGKGVRTLCKRRNFLNLRRETRGPDPFSDRA